MVKGNSCSTSLQTQTQSKFLLKKEGENRGGLIFLDYLGFGSCEKLILKEMNSLKKLCTEIPAYRYIPT